MTGMRAVLLSLVSAVCLLAQGTPVPVTPLQIIDSRGGKAIPCVNCALYTYSAGTTTPLATYTSATLGSVLPNPVRTNSAGYAVSGSSDITGVWIGLSCYKLILKDASAVTIWSQDQVCSQEELILLLLATSAGAGKVGYNQTTSYPSATVGARLERTINIADAPYSAVANGTGSGGTDQTVKIQAAIDYVHTLGVGTVWFPSAALCYTVTYPGLKIYSNITLDGPPGTCIQNKAAAYSSWPGGFTMISNDVTVTGATGMHVRNLTIDGNRANITGLSSSNLNAFGVGFFGASNSTVENTIVKNAGDNLYIDCSGSPRTTAGDGVVASGNVFTNAQRNNVSVICAKNTQILNNDLSFANGADPQAGIDFEENAAGQVLTGSVLRGNRIHDNTKDGADIQPAHDSAGTLALIAQGNLVYNNGSRGIVGIDFTSSQYINCDGNTVFGNTGVQMLLEGWVAGSCNGLVAIGGAVGLSMTSSLKNVTVSGYFSGSSYDLEADNTSSPVAMNPILAHGKVHGVQYFHGSFSPSGYDPTPGAAYGYIAQAYAPASTTVGNSNGIEVLDGVLGSGGAITAQRGMFCSDLTVASFNYCIQGTVSAGSNKYNIAITGTGKVLLSTGWEMLPVNLSVLVANYPCTSANYGHIGVINDATSATFNSVITGGGSNVGLAVCSSADSNYHFH